MYVLLETSPSSHKPLLHSAHFSRTLRDSACSLNSAPRVQLNVSWVGDTDREANTFRASIATHELHDSLCTHI